MERPRSLTIQEWDLQYRQWEQSGLARPDYGGPLARHIEDGDHRLASLTYDNSPAALRLWNFLLTEEDRLHEARRAGKQIVGTMKDLGTVPVMAYCLDNVVAFYPDGAWWIPCVMENSTHLLEVADSLGIDESFCPVRAMLGAFVTCEHFPTPDLLTCSVGATCDDFSAIAQRLEGLGHPILWWEIPHRRSPGPQEDPVQLPGGFVAPRGQVAFVEAELRRVGRGLEELTGQSLDEDRLRAGVHKANRIRKVLANLRDLAYTAALAPMPGLEMLIAEMLALHFCSDQDQCLIVLEALLAEVRDRVHAGLGTLGQGAVRVFWVNPVADLRVMNLLEQCGARVCGTDYLFAHALDPIPEDRPAMEALAMMALADPMVGTAQDRALRIQRDIVRFRSEAVVISRIPGASHCAWEGQAIRDVLRRDMDLPVVEIEVPSVSDAVAASIRTRLEALVETVRQRRIA